MADKAKPKPKRKRGPERWDNATHAGTSLALPAVHDADLTQPVNVRLLREYVRAQVVLPVLERLANTALGVTKYPTPVGAFGVVLALPAPAAVQVSAQKALLAIGIPNQLGLVDDDGNTLPGVIALPVLDAEPLADVPEAEAATLVERPIAAPLPSEPAYRPPPGLEVVEVDEGAKDAHREPDAAPPPPTAGEPAALAILERRRRRTRPASKRPNA